jgi:SAM-dependent methyltransferase
MERDWDQSYRDGDTPWDTGHPSSELVRVLQEAGIKPGRALDLGCGSGTNAIHLTRLGFDVTAVDLSATALTQARIAAREAGADCRFIEADLLDNPDLGPPFSFIFDRGCFHIIRQRDEPAIVALLDRHLAPGGHLLVLTGNTHETADEGPPKVSEAELRRAFEGTFDFVHLREFRFDALKDSDFRPLGWSVLLHKPA